MTDESISPQSDDPAESSAVAQKRLRRDPVPWLYGFGFLVMAAAILYLWQYPGFQGGPTADTAAERPIDQRIKQLEARLGHLEHQPTVDLDKITARIDALNARVSDQAQIASRLDNLSGRIESLSGRNLSGVDATRQQIDALTTRIAAIDANAGNLDAMAKRLNRIARLQEASFALASGQPVGDLPSAPSALARFAHAPPPTEAQLRLRFSRDEERALVAKQPNGSDAPFIDRVWERAQGLVTIRRGDDVAVGDASAVTLNHAQTALDAGDLSGAVAAVDALKGQSGEAMANWLSDAKALLSARSALTRMAAQS